MENGVSDGCSDGYSNGGKLPPLIRDIQNNTLNFIVEVQNASLKNKLGYLLPIFCLRAITRLLLTWSYTSFVASIINL